MRGLVSRCRKFKQVLNSIGRESSLSTFWLVTACGARLPVTKEDVLARRNPLTACRSFHHGWNEGWQDRAIPQNAEESLAARIAAISGKSQESLQINQGAALHVDPCNYLQIEISAARAMHEPRERDSHFARIKTLFAGQASPRLDPDPSEEIVANTVATRPCAIPAAALRTNHGRLSPIG